MDNLEYRTTEEQQKERKKKKKENICMGSDRSNHRENGQTNGQEIKDGPSHYTLKT